MTFSVLDDTPKPLLCLQRHRRHTCALTVLQATKDLREVSLWLGHASMQTTEIYCGKSCYVQ